ncbi:MAG: hypothetical protein IPH37_16845 [Burkholderiales bacterium]|nr:hypothetical protein [Burkholderiales bacterium]
MNAACVLQADVDAARAAVLTAQANQVQRERRCRARRWTWTKPGATLTQTQSLVEKQFVPKVKPTRRVH